MLASRRAGILCCAIVGLSCRDDTQRSCPAAAAPWSATCPARVAEFLGGFALTRIESGIAILGVREKGQEYERVLAVVGEDGAFRGPPITWIRSRFERPAMLPAGQRIWIVESSSAGPGLDISYLEAGELVRPAATISTPTPFSPDFRATADSGSFLVAWAADNKYGIMVLDGAMNMVASVEQTDERGYSVDAIASGGGVIAVALRPGTLPASGFVDFWASSDLAPLGRVPIPRRGDDLAQVRMHHRAGAFDVFVSGGSKRPMAYGRISANAPAEWRDPFHGNPAHRNELVSLQPLGAEGDTLLSYSRDDGPIEEGRSLTVSEIAVAEVAYPGGEPTLTEIWKSADGGGDLGPLFDGYGLLTLSSRLTQYLTILRRH